SRSRSKAGSTTPSPVVYVPAVACTLLFSLRTRGMAAVLPLDFNLLRKSRVVLPRTSERLMLSEFGRGNGALGRPRPDPKQCSPLPFSRLRVNADADVKARSAACQSELQVPAPLLPGLTASFHRRQRTASALRAIPLCLQLQTHFLIVATRVSQWSTPRQDRKRPNR